jgi:hypothetical protein
VTDLRARPGPGRYRALLAILLTGVAAVVMMVAAAAPSSAHVLPTTSLVLQVHEDNIDADASIPLADLEAATGTTLTDNPQSEVATHTEQLREYLAEHVAPTTEAGVAWLVEVGDLSVVSAGDTATTGRYDALDVSFTLVPPAGDAGRSINLGYDVVVHQVVTHVVIVSVGSDWSDGEVGAAREIGTIQLDTTTGAITPLRVDLGDGNSWQGFTSMVALGIRHIKEGTDHQLFLLTLLLPAPLLALRRRWGGPIGARTAVARITAITLAFTVGHSLTLALGALGVPAPQGTVEALIAVSILVAALHAIRPVFPGREALVAACFGLVHGLAFSETLRAVNLSGSRLALSLLGFNLGIEMMQLAVVALVLPPLVVLARTRAFTRIRLAAAAATAAAALGWLIDRLGHPNAVATLADELSPYAPWLLALLWVAALVALSQSARHGAGPRPRAAPPRQGMSALRQIWSWPVRTDAPRHGPGAGDPRGPAPFERVCECAAAGAWCGHTGTVERDPPARRQLAAAPGMCSSALVGCRY